MSEKGEKNGGFELPPHANAENHKRIMEWLRKATPKEVFDAAVQAGIYNPDGTLTEPYASEEPSAHRPTD
jgi:hypothetical protein